MFAGSLGSRVKRRGIILVVVLAMLGLLALIGVTFATFSSQAQTSARNFALASAFPDATELMDYALLQLIDDTGNPASALRGHSLKRDMYGHDAVNNGNLISGFQVTNATLITSGAYAGMIQLTTNIPSANKLPAGAAYSNYNFTRWILRFPAAFEQNFNSFATPTSFVSKSHEVLVDDNTSNATSRLLYVAVPDIKTERRLSSAAALHMVPPVEPTITGFQSANPIPGGGYLPLDLPFTSSANGWTSALNSLPGINPLSGTDFNTLPASFQNFVLDGRFLRAFNGPGVSGLNGLRAYGGTAGNTVTGLDNALMSAVDSTIPVGHPLSEYGNFRYNGNIFQNVVNAYTDYVQNGTPSGLQPQLNPTYGDPNDSSYIPSMDEDYDAPDLENWFLALQSADGQVVIPSFHRPGIITPYDWGSSNTPDPINPSSLTGPPRRYDPVNTWSNYTSDQKLQTIRAMSRILRPRNADGHSAVSFPDLVPDGVTKKINYDVDNDGDGTSDSVWLDLGYPPKRNAEGQSFKPLFAFMVIGLNGRLPLNTAGNLQKRDGNLQPLNDHAEHLGTSPSELDLRFALQNAYLPADGNGYYPYSQFDDAAGGGNPAYTGTQTAGPNPTGVGVGLTQLRNLLAGTRPYAPNTGVEDLNEINFGSDGAGGYNTFHLPNGVGDQKDVVAPQVGVYNPSPAVAGRWGEEEIIPGGSNNPIPVPPTPSGATGPFASAWINPIRAGLSVSSASYNGTGLFDARDDNFNTFDFNGEAHDTYDSAGAIYLPVERIRRFVTPIDVAGDGRVSTFNLAAGSSGADNWGRVTFLRFFRPPGVPTVSSTPLRASPPPLYPAPPYNPPAANVPAPIEVFTTPSTSGYTHVEAIWYDSSGYPNDTRSNNPYHGYMAAVTPQDSVKPLAAGEMPSDVGGNVTTLTSNTATVPTYTGAINTNMPSPALNEADEQNLYVASRLDAPFGAGDLEWLYRFQDRDGASLESRLMYLLPVSLTNPQDGLRRRRLFSIDTWETNNFVWANDNPQGSFPTNSRFTPVADASFASLNSANYVNGAGQVQHLALNTATTPHTLTSVNMTLSPDPASDFSVLSNGYNTTLLPSGPYPSGSKATQNPVATPSLAHRDRKINLNFPLPVSNSPYEPIRQKWIRETYQLLKAILPPRAVDTPEELAQLSQYVVNIIDFRDPDAAMTRFVNTDLVVTEPAPTGTDATTVFQPTLRFWNSGTDTVAPNLAPLTTPTGAAYDVTYYPTTTINATAPVHYLVQYGMEYQPVALNEVLSFQFQTKKVAANDKPNLANTQPMMFVELVNMLGKDALPESKTSPDSSNLDLTNWDFVVLPDDGMGRPDPYTGQIPLSQVNLLPTNAMLYSGGTLNLPNTTHPGQPYVLSVPLVGGRIQDGNGNSGGASAGTPASTGNTLGAGASMGTTANPNLTSYLGLPNPPSALSALPASTGNYADNPNTLANGLAETYYYAFGNSPIALTSVVDNKTTTYYQSTSGGLAPVAATLATAPLTTNYVDLTGMLYQRKVGLTAFPDNTSLNPGFYYWLYLRRPANPFDTNPNAEKVVVDSFRFVFFNSQGQGQTNTAATPQNDSYAGTNPTNEYIFSFQRMQPYRGGHAVPPLQSGASTLVTPTTGDTFQPAYGYSEQAVPGPYIAPTSTTASQYAYYFGDMIDNTNPSKALQITGVIRDTIGYANNVTAGSYKSSTTVPNITKPFAPPSGTQADAWDYFVFNDRDFSSVIELTLVPGCPPGLFTKQFAEVAPPIPTASSVSSFAFTANPVFYPVNTTTPGTTGPLTTDSSTWETAGRNVWSVSNSWPTFPSNGPPHTFPYLNDEFFYTAASEPVGGAAWTVNELVAPSAAASFRSETQDSYGNYNYVGGPSGAGWFKMFDFFEVPTTAFGAIGPVGQGMNYDWARQDLKPGLLNINLIIDEEVFLGLMGESLYGSPYSQSSRASVLSQIQVGQGYGNTYNYKTPQIVTQGAEDGSTTVPGASFSMPNNVGAFDYDLQGNPGNGMKACFADFLNMRGGGTNFLYGFGNAATGSYGAGVTHGPLDRELPFHSLSFPDITMTIMRPAALTPAATTTLPSPAYPWVPGHAAPLADNALPVAGFTWDPGIKNPYYFTTTSTTGSRQVYQPPPIPTRRLFQIPDAWGSPNSAGTPTYLTGPFTPTALNGTATFPTTLFPSNASVGGDANYNTLTYGTNLNNKHNNLVREVDINNRYDPTVDLGGRSYMLSGSTYVVQPTTSGGTVGMSDQRDHPYFRTEWLQKISNLTTVRTHQYAVWITVGFFEVIRQGNAQLAATRPDLAYDLLGLELGVLDSKNVRYRGFFVVDRTRAVGFNPSLPGDFRGCVTYRQLIE